MKNTLQNRMFYVSIEIPSMSVEQIGEALGEVAEWLKAAPC